jgi:NifU-like protein involved in Fe-S cluster formation
MEYYRKIIRSGFKNAGSFENPSIYLNTFTSRTKVCQNLSGYMRISLKVENNIITDAKYLCSCDPAGNVAVEIFCDLIKGKTIKEASTLKPEAFFAALGEPSEELGKSANALIELLNEGVTKFRALN